MGKSAAKADPKPVKRRGRMVQADRERFTTLLLPGVIEFLANEAKRLGLGVNQVIEKLVREEQARA